MLAVLEPTTLPSTRPSAPSRAEVRLTTNSGAEVPKATTVRPTISGGIFSLLAIATELLTIKSAPAINRTKPARINKNNVTIMLFF